MMKQLSRLFVAGAMVASLSGVVALAQPAPSTYAACGDNSLLTFPPWYRNLTVGGDSCELKKVSDQGGSDTVTIQNFVLIVALNIVEMILRLVAYATVVMLIIGGFQYITSSGDSGNMANAKKTIINAIVGLIISLFSVAIVSVIAGAV